MAAGYLWNFRVLSLFQRNKYFNLNFNFKEKKFLERIKKYDETLRWGIMHHD